MKKMNLFTVVDEAEDRVEAALVSAAGKDEAEVLEEDMDEDMATVEDSKTILPIIQVKMIKTDNRISS
jgi:hypothetical protein